MKNKKSNVIRVGVIGAGNWASFGHIPALQLLPDYQVTVVQSRRKEAAQATAVQFNIPNVVDTPQEVANHPEVDLVLVLTIAPLHAEGVRLALAAGKGVYTEWPFTTSTEKAEELLDLTNKSGARHIMGLQRRLSPTNRYLRDLIKDGYVGKLRSVRLHVSMNYFQALRSGSLKWTIDPENFSSVIAIYAGHFLDALFTVVGKPTSFSALTVNQFPEVTDLGTNEVIGTTTPDQLTMHGRLRDNAIFSVHIEGGKRNGSGVQLDITGDEGDIKVTNVSAFGGIGENYIIRGAHGDNLPLEILQVPEHYVWTPKSGLSSAADELAHLYAAYALDVKNNSQLATNFEDGLWMHKIMDGIEHSSKNGTVSLI
jgi:predicted dehydrogenase